MKIRGRTRIVSFLLLALTISAKALTTVHAETSTQNKGWRFQITPYLWLPKLNGRLNHNVPNVPNVSISRSRSDVLHDLNSAAFIGVTARKNQWVIAGDYSYASLSETDGLPYGFSAKVKTKQHIVSLLGGMHLPTGNNHGLDLLGGARYWDVRTNLSIQPINTTRKLKKSFVEPVVALRGRIRFGNNNRWSAVGYVDAGGVGNNSRHSRQAFATLNYAIKPNQHISLGYRYLKLKYKTGGQKLSVDYSGPLIGYSYQF